jgi:NTP pyrophosphatase (non-canonical NTP hydrolase)
MSNKKIDISFNEAKEFVAEFVNERDWQQFHLLKNLAMNISVEANELLELFLWKKEDEVFDNLDERTKINIADEMADVLIALCAFANVCNLDLSQTFMHKLQKTKEKYPVNKVKGKSDKYTTY